MNELYYYLIKQGADSETAKDIVQESVYKSMIHIESIDIYKYKPWLFRVAINLYYDYCRKNKKTQFLLLDENLVSNSKLIEDLMIAKDNQNLFKNTLDRLPHLQS